MLAVSGQGRPTEPHYVMHLVTLSQPLARILRWQVRGSFTPEGFFAGGIAYLRTHKTRPRKVKRVVQVHVWGRRRSGLLGNGRSPDGGHTVLLNFARRLGWGVRGGTEGAPLDCLDTRPLPGRGKGGTIRLHPQLLRWLGARLAFGRVFAFPGTASSRR